MDGKIRHINHIAEAEAIRFIQNILPVEWVQRVISPDYGIDIDLELFDYEDNVCVTLGEHVFLQVKGTHSPNYSKVKVFGDLDDNKEIDVIKYQIETSLLNLVERIGGAIPVLLIVVDLQKSVAYQICLNDYIKNILPYQNSNYKNQDSVTIYIPTDNVLDKNCCLWYGKRAKLYSLFYELLSFVDDLDYLNYYDYVLKVEKIIQRFCTNDAWKVKSSWYLLEHLYNTMITMKENEMISSLGYESSKHFCADVNKWTTEKVYIGASEIEISLIDYAKYISCKDLVEKIKVVSSTYEHNLRHMFMPSKLNYCIFLI